MADTKGTLDTQAMVVEEEILHIGMEMSVIGAWVFYPGRNLFIGSRKAAESLDLPADCLVPAGRVLRRIHRGDRRIVLTALRDCPRAVSQGGQIRFRVAGADHGNRWLKAEWREGEARGVGILTDVTEDVEATASLADLLFEQQMLLREVNHRVKNSLQLVASLLALEASGSADPRIRNAFDNACGRVVTVARLHERLYRGEEAASIDLAVYLPELIADLRHVLGLGQEVTLLLDIAGPLHLPTDQAVPLALLVNELVTNAVKHGFPDGRQGRIRVGLGPDPDDIWCLSVADDGVGLPPTFDPAAVGSLGMRLIRTLVRQIGGTLRLDQNHQPGTRFDLILPRS